MSNAYCKVAEAAVGRAAAAGERVPALGGAIKPSYLTLGNYARVSVVDMPDGEAMAKFSLALGSRGFARTTTLRAFDNDEAAALISAIP